ncbi:MAG TPA: acetate--CoA ligase family protein [Ramlibacter sp.]|uniref:acetate--CoA ligase family protein n=1 Tax=Ramlibacter sp. TaxID=1917967 RepID=UPI002C8638CC|nr:acetate--CoA ligase family protein [Ramlibacter sp.]HVZ44292.1 acetate--CoA ligase family protein [Ramlibacter sp.]
MTAATPALHRLPDERHDGGLPLPLTCIGWEVHWPDGPPARLASYLSHLLRGRYGRGAPGDDPIEAAAASIAIELQTGGSIDAAEWFAALRLPSLRGFRYATFDPFIGVQAGVAAFHILRGLALDETADLETFRSGAARSIDEASKRLAPARPHESPLKAVLAALSRGIPVTRLCRQLPAYRLGTGRRQQQLWRGFTGATGYLATALSTHKEMTNDLLREQGFPVARQQVVLDAQAAVRAAGEIGYPVVVKPTSTDYGTAVSTRLQDAEAVTRAFELARKHGAVLVESHIDGFDHRLTVIGGRCVGVVRREAPTVTGNGRDTVAHLAAELARRRRADPIQRRFAAARVDEPLVAHLLREQGLSAQDVPAEGRIVRLRSNSNLSSGGLSADVTHETHPDNLVLAERVASSVGLDHAGIDFITPDIARPWHEAGGAICEVNATPAFTTADAHQRLLDHLFPDGGNGCVPLAVLEAGAADATRYFGAIEAIAAREGRCGGFVRPGEARVGEHLVARGEDSLDRLAAIVLADARVQFVLVAHEGGTLDLPYCDAVVGAGDAHVEQQLCRALGLAHP